MITDADILALKSKVHDIEVKVKKLDSVEVPIEILPNGKAPYKAHTTDAGYDLFAAKTAFILPGKSFIMPTGIKVAVPEGYEIQIRPRSGISSKVSLRVANSPGTIDSGYRDELGVILYNAGGDALTKSGISNSGPIDIYGEPWEDPHASELPRDTIVVREGDRIAQMVLSKITMADFLPVRSVKDYGIDREGGFGSSGAR